MLSNYIPIALMLVIAGGFGVIMVNISKWIGPRRPNYQKLTTYESGMIPVGTTRERVSIKYYVVGMLFIIFDIELVFLYPWAVIFKSLGAYALWEMFIFIALLFVAYLYILKKGALEWD
jgi:NADH-quinone oxidoreductase subunit A